MIAYRYNISYAAPMALHHPQVPVTLYKSGLYRDRRNCNRQLVLYAKRRNRPLSDFRLVRIGGEHGQRLTAETRFMFVERPRR